MQAGRVELYDNKSRVCGDVWKELKLSVLCHTSAAGYRYCGATEKADDTRNKQQ